jgi:osmotically-inducible protein OsmY
MRRNHLALIAALGLALSGVACDDTFRGAEKDTKENTEAAKKKAKELGLDKAAHNAAEEMRELARKAKHKLNGGERESEERAAAPAARQPEGDVDRTLGQAKNKLEEAGREIGGQIKGMAIHADIKAALMKDDVVDASRISVEVDDDAHLIVLHGSVPTGAQKAAAEMIAREKSRGYLVRNELQVGR